MYIVCVRKYHRHYMWRQCDEVPPPQWAPCNKVDKKEKRRERERERERERKRERERERERGQSFLGFRKMCTSLIHVVIVVAVIVFSAQAIPVSVMMPLDVITSKGITNPSDLQNKLNVRRNTRSYTFAFTLHQSINIYIYIYFNSLPL